MPAPTPEKLNFVNGIGDFLQKNIIGQSEVLPSIIEGLENGELGLTDPQRPKAGFLFLGPTGVGKTEITRFFTQYIFGSEDSLIRLDMSEYKSKESMRILLGSNVNEEGVLGKHFHRVGGKGTLLFDEIEKADKEVIDLFLQIFDAARISLATGETLDLSQFYVVATSNIAATDLLNANRSTRATLVRHVEARARAELRPEIFARMSSVCVFDRLSYEDQAEISELLLKREIKHLTKTGFDLQADHHIATFLLGKGFHPRLGARPLRGAIERYVRRALREDLKAGGDGSGTLYVNTHTDSLSIKREAPVAPPEQTEPQKRPIALI